MQTLHKEELRCWNEVHSDGLDTDTEEAVDQPDTQDRTASPETAGLPQIEISLERVSLSDAQGDSVHDKAQDEVTAS